MRGIQNYIYCWHPLFTHVPWGGSNVSAYALFVCQAISLTAGPNAAKLLSYLLTQVGRAVAKFILPSHLGPLGNG